MRFILFFQGMTTSLNMYDFHVITFVQNTLSKLYSNDCYNHLRCFFLKFLNNILCTIEALVHVHMKTDYYFRKSTKTN